MKPWAVAAIVVSLAAGAGCPAEIDTDPDDGSGEGAGGSTTSTSKASTATTGGAGCPSANENDGTYLLSISTNLNPPKPIVLRASVALTGPVTATAATITLQPLSAMDQTTPVCGPITVPIQGVSSDGLFTWDFGSVSLCGEANPISGAQIDTTLGLTGTLCSGEDGFVCGAVSGIVSSPVSGFDLVGSTFTMQRYEGAPPPALLNCEKDPAQF